MQSVALSAWIIMILNVLIARGRAGSAPVGVPHELDPATALAVAAAHPVTTATMTHVPAVELRKGVIYFSVPCNRAIDRQTSIEAVRTVTASALAAWGEAGLLPGNRYQQVTVRKSQVWSAGYWHMGAWEATAYLRGILVPAEQAAA